MSIEMLAYESTELGLLCLRRRESLSKPGLMITEVTLNHEFLMSSYLTASEEALSRIGVEMTLANSSPRPGSKLNSTAGGLSVLVGGLGLGYTAAAVLEFPNVGSVEVIEFLPQVIEWTKKGLIPLSESLNADERLQITAGDIYATLAGESERQHDLIAIDVDHSPEEVLGEQSNGFYSIAGLEKAKRHLKVGGVLGVWSYADSSPLLTYMEQVFTDVKAEQITVMNDLINEEQTDWLFFGRRG